MYVKKCMVWFCLYRLTGFIFYDSVAVLEMTIYLTNLTWTDDLKDKESRIYRMIERSVSSRLSELDGKLANLEFTEMYDINFFMWAIKLFML